MSSLARRALRATAAVAGIAAGVGLAGPAFAAPEAPERPSSDESAPAPAPQERPAPAVVGDGAPETSSLPELPQLFTIRDTGVYTAGPGTPQLPAAQDLPEALPSPDGVVNLGEDDPARNTDVNFRTAAPQGGSAMQELDTASVFGDLPDRVLGATANNDIR